MGKWNKVLFIVLAVALVASIGGIVYLTVMPKEDEKFTEFYILGAEGKAEGYPEQAVVGEPVEVILGVVNHEYRLASYRVKIAIDNVDSKEIDIGILAHGERWQRRVSFTPQVAREGQRVEFYLFRDGEDRPYFEEPLRLYIDVLSP
ncbi:MAG TPA: DUF1616 domain-containing protein [Dehalococcoidia bacterium]|nr:DUF1616 domain-containing protein [Dehalococcoidia bacterium]